MHFGNFEITKREVLTSISIIAILLTIGLLISSKISERIMDKNEIYNKAVKIDSSDMFEYGIRTNIGNAFVYGDLEAIDTVTYPEIGGEYMYVEKIEEHYTPHTRQVAHTRTVNGQTQTYYTTETYWTWDMVGREDVKCKEVSFLDVPFDSYKIALPSGYFIDIIQVSGYVRYKYYGVDTYHTGTLFTEIKDHTISDNTSFYKDMTITETVERLESNAGLVVFWIFWVLLMCVCVFVFYYIDNKWLE